jgi:hypothetical protein
MNSGDDLDQGGFSSSIVTGQGEDFARLELQGNFFEGMNPAKALGNIFSLQQR